ncbi:uncharacterized protein [Nicotiana sylvestris]|uniref:uncharacterized protein n=1 Tax=Nicotiana sylvestris TaxID=4096 RepID=UPI00388C6B3F
MRLQAKEAYEFALQKSKRSNKKKKKRLVKNGEVVCDKDIPVVEVDEKATEEPSSLVKGSHKKKQSTSEEGVAMPSSRSVKSVGKLKEVVSDQSLSDEDMLDKSSGKGKSSVKSGKRKVETVREPDSAHRVKCESLPAKERLRYQKVLWGHTFDPAISEMACMRKVIEMVGF